MGKSSRRSKASNKKEQENEIKKMKDLSIAGGASSSSTTTSMMSTNDVEMDLFWPVQPPQKTANRNNNNDEGMSVDENDDEEEDDDNFSEILDSIVKIHCTHSEPDSLIPWQKRHQSTSTSSGFVIELLLPSTSSDSNDNQNRRRIMTNAHSIEYGNIVQVQKRGQEHKYEAFVEHIANEADLAILRILEAEEGEEFDFWTSEEDDDDNDENDHDDGTQKGPKPLTFASLPELQEEVDVLGYPTGGDSLSVTTGVLSRIEMQEYTQANTNLLAMQVDAAINPGNSGGPVVNDDYEVIVRIM